MLDLIGLHERVADATALRDEERERHRAADRGAGRSGRAARRSRRACRSPSRRRARRRTGASARRASAPSTSTSRASSRPAADGNTRGGPTIDACARCAAPNASFDVDVAELGEVRRERGIVRLLARIEAQVLDQHDLARLEALRAADRVEVGDARRERHLAAEQLAQPVARPARASTSGRPCPSAGRGASSTTISQSPLEQPLDRRAAPR